MWLYKLCSLRYSSVHKRRWKEVHKLQMFLEGLKINVVVQVLLSTQQISHEYVTLHESWMPNN